MTTVVTDNNIYQYQNLKIVDMLFVICIMYRVVDAFCEPFVFIKWQ